ncbi:MAG: Germination-specific N-acetylmuramoyl-L-alanine amidase precursor [Pelotomaculum sp. PtaB.Bin104]|nr:MAG: Germination-specific N-acetylmuramoyl-L-alanine amidase precursor [Pelotomaculum sp. PtaB.Bin104]
MHKILHIVYVKKGCILALSLLIALLVIGFQRVSSRYEEPAISALSWTVANKLIVIDPGHGGLDPGALGSMGVHEKDIVLDVSKKLASILREAGAEAVLTRETDQELSDPGVNYTYSAKIQDLTRRVELANSRRADVFVSVHVNSFPNPREDGAQTFCQPGSEESKKLAMAIQNECNRFLANQGRKTQQVDYFANRMTKMPSTIVEIGFITNPREEKLMLDQQYQSKVAWAIYAGIVRYFAQPKSAIAEPSR